MIRLSNIIYEFKLNDREVIIRKEVELLIGCFLKVYLVIGEGRSLLQVVRNDFTDAYG
ncbi:MAG: hypothetical protein ACJAU0_001237 [Flavobacteriales bacterium]|jgi:hypothetical protein